MIEGIYEALITQLISQKLEGLDDTDFYVHTTKLDKEEAARVLSRHLSQTIQYALGLVIGDSIGGKSIFNRLVKK